MSLRKIDGQSPLPPTPRATPAPAAGPSKNAPPTPGAISSFTPPTKDTAALGAPATSAKAFAATASAAADVHAPAVGPLPTSSPDAQRAIAAARAAVAEQNPSLGKGAFDVLSVERDQLGMTHVRLGRVVDGTKVFGNQVIAHVGADGKVEGLTGDTSDIPLPAEAKSTPALTNAQALNVAKKDFGKSLSRTPTAERVLYQTPDGQYHQAYHVQLANFASKTPAQMDYFVDAQSGKVLNKYNKLDPMSMSGAAAAEGLADETSAQGSAAPNNTLWPFETNHSTIHIGQDISVDQLQGSLNMPHWGSATVTLTSPSGKTVELDSDASQFDLSKAFAGESAKGDWTLTVHDGFEFGHLKSWGLNIHGKGSGKGHGGGNGGGGDGGGGTTGTPGTGDSIYSGTVSLGTKQNSDGTFSMEDDSRGGGKTMDANNHTRASGSDVFKDSNNVWGESSDDPREKAAVDAHYGMEMTWDFYKNELGRNSIDGKGEALNSYVHVGTNYDNAFWDGSQMNYGDGDGSEFGPLVAIDIAGHEISHGLTERTAGLEYQGESGSLNEAWSDIMGTGVKWYASQKNPDVKFNWTIGSDAYTPGTPGDGLRYLNDPTADGYSLDNFKNFNSNTEVHSGSGIANNAFYLAVQGGSNRTSGMKVDQGIGMDHALKIFYRAEAYYMTPTTTFSQAREACLEAATDLYGAGSQEVKTLGQAWSAVGVN